MKTILKKRIVVFTFLNFDSSYLSKNSERNGYPCACRKSSNKAEETSLESFKKQNNVTNISTSSNGDSSGIFFIFSIHSETQDFAKKRAIFPHTDNNHFV